MTRCAPPYAILLSAETSAALEALQRNVLQIRRRILRKEHPDTLRSMVDLSFILTQEGSYSEAEQLNREALDLRRGAVPEVVDEEDCAVPLLEAAFRLYGWRDETEAAEALGTTPAKVRAWRRGAERMDITQYMLLTSSVNVALVEAVKSRKRKNLGLSAAAEALGVRHDT